jgi:hypothetical protein
VREFGGKTRMAIWFTKEPPAISIQS